MNILVTGANGFIGSSLIERLAASGHQCDGLDIVFSKELPLRKAYQIDLSKEFQLDEEYDYVFHLGAYNVTHVGDKDREKYQKINVEGTRNLLKACRIKNFIFLSTVKVYRQEDGNIDEDSVLLPISDYAQSKLDAEKVCQELFSGEHLIIFRSVNVVGSGQSMKALLPVFFDKALKNETIEIFVPRLLEVHLLYIDDIVDLFMSVLQYEGEQWIFNIPSKDSLSIEDAARRIKDICHSSSEIMCSNDNVPVNARFESKRIFTAFDWKPKVGCSEIIKTFGEYVNNE